ncbi:MAG TPA: UbiA family prenyltransferase [Allosphingosinicella sp.]|nr:UbiA family prenyltransferase [Allosphingosinicella sp.]
MGISRKIRSIAAGRDLARHSGPARLAEVARASEWWEFKLVPLFAMFYATALVAGAPLHDLGWAALTLMAAIVPGAAYVSIVNDLTDRKEDAAAGKANRLANRSGAAVALLIAVPISIGLFFAWTWRNDLTLLLPYLAAWAAFTLYSVPPFRLKTRGVAGVLADASGAHLFPTLVAVMLVIRSAGVEANAVWLAASSLWALAYGLRGIIWHQLLDDEADRRAAVDTFVQRSERRSIIILARWIIFPIELCAFSILLSQMPSWLPILFLGGYGIMVRRKLKLFRLDAVIVEPKERHLIILNEYYDLFLPLALLVACAWRWPWDAAALLLHFLLFPRRLVQTSQDMWKLRPFQRR